MRPTSHAPDVVLLLRTEHAVARVLAQARDERDAYPALLAAVGESLAWDTGAVWAPSPDGHAGELRRIEAWPASRPGGPTVLSPGDALARRVWEEGRAVWLPDADQNGADDGPPRSRDGRSCALAFPVTGATGVLAVIELGASDRRDCDEEMLDTVAVLGSQIGQFVERSRAQRAVRESDARKSAILNAAYDCIITLDHRGHVIELNDATERTFGHAAADMVGRELIGLVVPPPQRDGQRRAFARFVETGESPLGGGRVELTAMHADGTEFPIDLAITRPDVPGPPLFCCYVRDLSERHAAEQALRHLAAEQAALRRVATAVAAETAPEEVFALVTEEVGRLLDARSANMVRFSGGDEAEVLGGWNAPGARSVPVGGTVVLDGDTAAARVLRTGRPVRVDDYGALDGTLAATLRELGFRSAVAAPVTLGGSLWGAVIVSSADPDPAPPGAEQRLGDFAELVAQALANAGARREVAASRARIVEAADAERRRLERNLHDGAQQRLVSLSLTLGLVARRLDANPEARSALERARDDLGHALEELRDFARGIHPAVLTDRGLEPALASLAARAPLPVAVSVALDDRLPEPVEVAAYYVVAEALTNAARHAHASMTRVDVRRADGVACVEVADDGVGGAGGELGSGLRGLVDRVEALGGRLVLQSAPGAGTTVRVEIPVG
jgi:PAS domain S-box-containing protein